MEQINKDEGGNVNNSEHANEPNRTPPPSDWEHILILLKQRIWKDKKQPKLWLARTFLACAMLLIYTIGFSVGYDPNAGSVDGDYRLFEGEEWHFPNKVHFGGFSNDFVSNVSTVLSTYNIGSSDIILTQETDRASFEKYCEENVELIPFEEACAFFDNDNGYTLLYNSADFATPFDSSLAGAQWYINNALLNLTGVEPIYPVEMTQQLPQLIDTSKDNAPIVFTLMIGILTVLSLAISLQFISGPMTFEKIQEVVRAYTLVGVKLRTYMLHWIIYFSLNGILTAVCMTLLATVWNLYPLSNALLIFLSHYFALVHIIVLFTVIAQIVEQEELAQGLPFLAAFLSMGVAATGIIIGGPDSIFLMILTVVSPFIGIIQFTAIYVNYDVNGVGTGVHPGDNMAESGLMGSMIAQIIGIVVWMVVVELFASKEFTKLFNSNNNNKNYTTSEQSNNNNNNNVADDATERMDDFEPLQPGKEVLLSVRGLFHTFIPNCAKKMCDSKNAKSVDVLKGLDMDICRGEVFSYLGHNGAGKTTSVRILSGELDLMDGNVTYNLRDGPKSLDNTQDLELIRSKIGVCPQHNNALQEDLTCREMLRLFAQLKGRVLIAPGQTYSEAIEAEIDRRLSEIKFTSSEDADKPVGTYSGGMKRKVSIAIALLGDPEVVFLDEPTAGMDPYNRRTVWDMIIEAKVGRSIILTTHFMDEADVLSDRVGIIKNGKLITCGSTLFLKHHFGVGYTLKYEEADAVDIAEYVQGAEHIPQDATGVVTWRLHHGTENSFPSALHALSDSGARNVTLELTTLEQVFLETGKEDQDDDDNGEEENNNNGDANDDDDDDDNESIDLEDAATKASYLGKIWDVRGTVKALSFTEKFLVVQHFMMTNAWKIKGIIFLNIGMPLIYLVGGMVAASLPDNSDVGERIEPDAIPISASLLGDRPLRFFGIENSNTSIFPIDSADVPQSLDDLFDGGDAFIGGYYAVNQTLQYNSDENPFALQAGIYALTTLTLNMANGVVDSIMSNVQELPYISELPFRVDLLVIPLVLGFGFVGMTFSVLDVLLLRGDNVISLFKVGGISEWSAYLGVMMYKTTTTFSPFFVLVIILGLILKSMLLGNGGRWLATIIIMLSYAFSTTPIGLILGKRFIKSNVKEVANWFPGVYMTFVSLPYTAWNIALQAIPESRDTILIFGDVLCIVPPVAFQRALGAVIEISTKYNDPDLTWGDVWQFRTRVWFSIMMMIGAGTLQWIYLYKLTMTRPETTKVSSEQADVAKPDEITASDVKEERDHSRVDNEGINTRDIVKIFQIPPSKDDKDKKTPIYKRSVKGVSYGVKKNEIYALLGPNGAGKSVSMGVLSGDHTPEHGEITLDRRSATKDDKSILHLYERCNISYCPQFDALFPKKTVLEHLQFYTRIRGLDWNEEATQEHVNAIVKLLGLGKHRDKESTELSGGYKRRLCLGIAMIGYPKCIMVDECTTGMDPGARHLVWNVLKPGIRHDYDLPAILLSTHYMDEATKLGSRIGIMIDGELVTTGTLDNLQNRYCTSYFVEVSLAAHAADPDGSELELIEKFKENGMEAETYESLPYHFKLQIPFIEGGNNTKQLANIFDLLESNRESLSIKFYSVAQMNLEQIFIDLSRKQFAADEKDHQSTRDITGTNSNRSRRNFSSRQL